MKNHHLMQLQPNFWYARWELLELYNGVLCIRWIQNDSIQLKICTPRSLRDIILWYLHDSQTAGHMVVKRTTA